MSLDVEPLESKIRAILSAPGVDLKTISAKRVRKRLMEDDSTLTMEIVKDNKEEIDDLIGRVYAEVNGAEQGSEEEETKPNKRSRGNEHDGDGDEDEEGEAPPKKKKAKKGQEKSDEKLARKLSNEINGRATRAGKSRSNGTSKNTSKKGRSKKSAKSATTVDSDDEGGDEGGKKKKRGGGGKGGFAKEYNLSEPLSALLQVDKMSRPQVVKGLWNYIKGNELQNPANKREIMCDTNLKAVFNVEKINMFQMNKVLGEHLHEPEAES